MGGHHPARTACLPTQAHEPKFSARESRALRRGRGHTANRHPLGVPLQNDATASYLGYIFQGQYALLALWDAEDDDAAVSVETADDVELEGNDPRLAQLKHSTGTPAALSITNAGFWKTLRIWAAHLLDDPMARTGDAAGDRTKYLFVTVATLAAGDALDALVRGVARTDATLSDVLEALVTEAKRVRDERAAAAATGEGLPHADRAAGCEAFLGLSEAERRRLTARIEILPASFRITDIRGEVERRLQRAGSVRATIRASVAERLIERWDRQVALALMTERTREIRRTELLGLLEDLIREHGPAMLPNDYGARQPDADEYAAAEGSTLERQILLVKGGAARVERAVRDRWRARNQRRRWTDFDASLVLELKAYDDVLKEAWSDRHGPMCDDCRGHDDDERCRRGLEILDWAHGQAPAAVPPPRTGWSDGFYVRGMLQQLADELQVGWHPEYRERLGALPAGAVPAATSPARGGDGAARPTEPAATGDVTLAADLSDQLPSALAPIPGRTPADSRRTARPRRGRAAQTE